MSGENGKALQFGRLLIPRFTMEDLSIAGRSVEITGMMHAEQTADGIAAMTLRDMALGYGPQNPDEDVVPLISAHEPRLDGFYLVDDVSYKPHRVGLTATDTAQPITLKLTKLAAAQVFEVMIDGWVRVNGFGLTGLGRVAVPGGTPTPYVLTPMAGAPSYGATNLVTATGNLRQLVLTAGYIYGDTLRATFQAPEFYNGACLLELSDDGGTTWKTWVGREIPDQANSWRISNGLVRVTRSPLISAASADVQVETWITGSGWKNGGIFTFGSDNGAGAWSALGVPDTMAVLRNSTEVLTIQLVCGPSVGTYTVLEMSLSRGSDVVEALVYTGQATTSIKWGMGLPVAKTDIGVGPNFRGIVATNPTDVRRQFILSNAVVTTGANFVKLSVGATYAYFGFGHISSAGTAAAAATDAENKWYAATDFQQNFVIG